ncbi:hypothetical protein N7494_005768 [Penicillium frequentans]|uniref:Uncharacterized protein n=1 Tax=Penicillium frequentans TaxID=3151616 RepID=A0AAD6GDW6_9EURO|nr:hypothetical protein N7494_005768 [Penicillium glabrum]
MRLGSLLYTDFLFPFHPAGEGGHDVLALGTVIVTSSHLHARKGGFREIDYSFAEANEAQAVALAKIVLKDVIVPEIYFASNAIPRSIRSKAQRITAC